ncbi:hypothetical protein [Thermomonospora umbrina]|uniref:Uncharacterized protein n=1 Tax=Thermomonospora umbrina TaxID=111806 RepID=A0A3D9SM14_9ACTN|nr:hypothetical protein [Thermomonospora umbrina]REE96888.1 hypothetical protein DFJ69_2341 [Thermomonospora umbrina]
MTSIRAEWALWGVAPDSRDYEVRACSDGTLRRSHFEKIITRFSPGTPDSEGALPRVTIAAVDIAKVPHLGMALQSPESYAEGRGTTTTRFFFFPYQAMSEGRVGYRALYEHLSPIELPESGTAAPITIEPPPIDPDLIGEDLRRLGPGTVRAGALLVRDQQVCVTQAELTTLDDRLRYLDGVAAQLPYGYRAKLTATTWANSATRHRLRLSFARRAPGGTAVIPWRGSSAVAAGREAVEEEHVTPLMAAFDRHGAATVIQLLAADPVPRSCDDPEPARRALRAMAGHGRPPDAALDVDELRELFAEDPDTLPEADVPGARDALGRFIERAEPRDWPLIESWWGRLAADDASPLLAPMLDRCRRMLWSGERVRLHAQLLIAYRHDRGDEFLAGLVTPPEGPPEAAERGAATAAQLVHDSVLATGAATAHPLTLRTLLEHPPVLCELIALLAALGSEPLGHGIAWLESGPAGDHDVVGVFRDLLSGDEAEPLTGRRLLRLAAAGRSCVAALLDSACESGVLPALLPPFVEMLGASPDMTSDDRRHWAGRLDGRRAADPYVSGSADVLVLALGGRPAVGRRLAADPSGAYLRGFLRAWRLPWPEGGRPAEGLVTLLRDRRGVPDPALQVLAERLHKDLPRSIGETDETAVPEEADEVPEPVAHRPHATVIAEGTVVAADDATAILDQLAQGFRRGLSPDLCVQRLVTRPWTPTAEEAVDVVRRLSPALVALGAAPMAAHRWSVALIEYVLLGAFGDDLTGSFREAMLTGITSGVRGELLLLSAMSADGRPPQRHRRELGNLHRELGRLLGPPGPGPRD